MKRFAVLAPWREGNPWVTNAALFALGCVLLALARQFLVESDHFVIGMSGVSGWSAIVYLAAVAVVLTQPVNRWTFRLIVAFALAFQVMVYFDEPFSSSDIYRYVWDGIVQHARVNPYRYVPGDPALSFLRVPNQEVFNNINRRDYARTIYPPVAQIIYWMITFFSPTVAAMKLAMIGFAAVAGAALTALLRRMGHCPEEVLLFAWCPILVWEVGLAGHVDAVVLAFIALALLFRYERKPVWTGVFLGLAILTKFYPVILLPALWMRRDWKMPAVIVAITAVTYAMYASAGRYVVGFLSGYREEEGLNTGARYFLLQWTEKVTGLHIPVNAYLVFCALVFLALLIWAWRKASVETLIASDEHGIQHPVFIRVAAASAFALMLLFSPHYPWYVLWLLPFFALVPNLPLAAYLMGMFYLLTTALAEPGPKMFLLNERLYGTVAIALVIQAVTYRWPLRKHFVLASHRP